MTTAIEHNGSVMMLYDYTQTHIMLSDALYGQSGNIRDVT